MPSAASLMCFTWFCIIGGTAPELELSGVAEGDILEADLSAQLFATVESLFTAQWVLRWQHCVWCF